MRIGHGQRIDGRDLAVEQIRRTQATNPTAARIGQSDARCITRLEDGLPGAAGKGLSRTLDHHTS